jgi:hypothetical protein
MSPLPVVGLDVVEELASGRGPRGPGGVVDEFDLEGGEEALGDSVVPAVPPPAHAADDAMAVEGPAVVAARVLRRRPAGWSRSPEDPEYGEESVAIEPLDPNALRGEEHGAGRRSPAGPPPPGPVGP